ncbi:unnamed protein product [Gongylonema pulchrum]|uniref:DNA-directed RNA polymerase n=1 Tax=Gongylonema pulchrum TaxID=637853 RepID=A0A183D0K0_9BILA|nr:unnamed protein product [Gongylonema pulchrum]
MTGQVLINNEAVRVPSYATYQISNGSLRIVVELEAKLGDANKCLLRKTDCSIHVCFSCSLKARSIAPWRTVESRDCNEGASNTYELISALQKKSLSMCFCLHAIAKRILARDCLCVSVCSYFLSPAFNSRTRNARRLKLREYALRPCATLPI